MDSTSIQKEINTAVKGKIKCTNRFKFYYSIEKYSIYRTYRPSFCLGIKKIGHVFDTNFISKQNKSG